MTTALWDSIPIAWQELIAPVRQEIDAIDELIAESSRQGHEVIPEVARVFSFLKVKPSDVSVVLLGQDPYPNAKQAIGMAFAVPLNTKPLPGSLRNIFKEVESDIGSPPTADCTLEHWVNQGTLLINTSLTTTAGDRNSHASWPWDPVVKCILEKVVEINPRVVALLWGNHAKNYAHIFDPRSLVMSAHPSPLSASRGFLGSKPFSRVNSILAGIGKPVINW